MSKAYNRVEWAYLEKSLEVMGFPSKFIFLVMQCVKSVSFSILVNGIPKGPIFLSQGFCQGDTLPPYLFLICMEGLVSLLNKLALESGLKGIRVCRGAPLINYILFVNDSLIFCKANRFKSQKLLDLLEEYAMALGQHINEEKTTMIFSRNVRERDKHEIMALWGTRNQQHHEKYLDLPHIIGKSRKRDFSDIKARV